jgi:hypothetical protein
VCGPAGSAVDQAGEAGTFCANAERGRGTLEGELQIFDKFKELLA